MSVQAREWVWHHSKAKDTELLLLAIAEHMRDDPRAGAWPSQSRLAAMINRSVRQVQRLAKGLEERGLLAIAANGGLQRGEGRRPDLYRFPELLTAAELGDTQVSGNSSELGDTQVSGNSRACQPELRDIAVSELGDTAMSELGDIWMSPEQREQIEQRGGRRADALPPSPLPEFLDHCKEHRHIAVPPPCRACGRQRKANAAGRGADVSRPRRRKPWCEQGSCNRKTRRLDEPAGAKCPRCHPDIAGWADGNETVTTIGRTP